MGFWFKFILLFLLWDIATELTKIREVMEDRDNDGD